MKYSGDADWEKLQAALRYGQTIHVEHMAAVCATYVTDIGRLDNLRDDVADLVRNSKGVCGGDWNPGACAEYSQGSAPGDKVTYPPTYVRHGPFTL